MEKILFSEKNTVEISSLKFGKPEEKKKLEKKEKNCKNNG